MTLLIICCRLSLGLLPSIYFLIQAVLLGSCSMYLLIIRNIKKHLGYPRLTALKTGFQQDDQSDQAR